MKNNQELIKVLIVDDEESAIKVLISEIANCSLNIQVVGTAKNVPDAVIAINKTDPDVVLLDVEMPEYNGFELFKFFKFVTFQIIITTAYSKYLTKSLEMAAIDFLLKPIEQSKLEIAFEEILDQKSIGETRSKIDCFIENNETSTLRKIAIPTKEGVKFLEIDKISLISADGSYSNIYFEDGSRFNASKNLNFFVMAFKGLPSFYRCHRSHFVNLNYIYSYLKGSRKIVLSNNIEVAVSRELKKELEVVLSPYQINFKKG